MFIFYVPLVCIESTIYLGIVREVYGPTKPIVSVQSQSESHFSSE